MTEGAIGSASGRRRSRTQSDGGMPRDAVATGEPSDEVLAVRVRGDPAAFAPFYTRYANPVWRYCRFRIANETEAEDTAALIFTRALAAMSCFEAQGDGTFRAWLFTIAHNAVANAHRDRVRRVSQPLAEANGLSDPNAPSPDGLAVAADEHRNLLGALAQIPDDQRRVVELRLAGLTGPEIAQVVGKSHAAVKMLQLRAVRRLRQLLGSSREPTGASIEKEEPGATRRSTGKG